MKNIIFYTLILIFFNSCKAHNPEKEGIPSSEDIKKQHAHSKTANIVTPSPIQTTNTNTFQDFLEPSDDILVKIRLNSENQNIYIDNYQKYSVDCNNDYQYEFKDIYGKSTCSYSKIGITTLKVSVTKEEYPNEKDRLFVWDDKKINNLISITNTPSFRERTMAVTLNTDNDALVGWDNFDEIIPFIATYITHKPDVTIHISINNLSTQTASYEVDCDNDGIYENRYYGTDSICHFKQPGNHQIAMRGEIPNLQLYDGDNYYLKSIDQWGTIQWGSMYRTMARTHNATITAKDAPDLSHVTDMSEMFARAEKMNANINHWDVSNVKNMKEMFYMANSFNHPLDKWNTSNVVNMTSMFAYARKFNQNINSWNVSNVKNMSGMFYKAEKFNKPLDKWDVSHVEYMPDMFAYTFYNKPLRTWNLASLKDARGMFEHSSSDKYTDATPILFFKDKVFQDKVCQRIESIGRKCYLLYNEAADPWRDRDDYPDDPAYQKDDNDYERIF